MRSFDTCCKKDELGLATIQEAIKDLHVRDQNLWGPRIADYGRTINLNGPHRYCQSALHTWILQASQATGIYPPVRPDGSAKNTMFQFRKVNRWLDRNQMTFDMIKPGMNIVWDRGTAEEPWRGHAGLVEYPLNDGNTFQTIEANILDPSHSGQRGVFRRTRTFNDPKLLGFGILSGPMPWEVQHPEKSSSLPWLLLPVGLALGSGITIIGIKHYRGEKIDPKSWIRKLSKMIHRKS